jgi:hypothetical protein
VTILEELSDTRSRVGLSDLGSLLGVEPDCGLVFVLVRYRVPSVSPSSTTSSL